jgi:minichromosome maintenance protein 10
MLYSVIRLSRDGATYDLPVDGDWLTIAVVAERGEVKISGTKNTSKNDDDSDDGEEPEEGGPVKDPKKPDFKKKGKPEYKKRPPRKYINLKLCSLPPRSRSGSSTSGDALLQLLLFESDSVATEVTENEEGEKVTTKRYLGGSGGAYERWCNLTVGSVIAIMNPKVLRPLRVSPSSALSSLEKS